MHDESAEIQEAWRVLRTPVVLTHNFHLETQMMLAHLRVYINDIIFSFRCISILTSSWVCKYVHFTA